VDNPEAILRKKRVRRFASCSQDQADPTFGSHSDDANEASAIGDLHTTNSSQPHAPIANVRDTYKALQVKTSFQHGTHTPTLFTLYAHYIHIYS